MVSVNVEPYNSVKEKLNIVKKLNHLNQKFSDLGGLIYYIKNDDVKEELTASKLCYLEKKKCN